MKKFKKFLLSVLSLALVAVLSIGGTLAYLKSEDSDVNVMTMGNVKIAQHEYERVINDNGEYEMVTSTKYGEGYKLQEFTQDKPLYPATGSVTGWGTAMYFDQLSDKASGGQKVLDGLENVVDKVVLVENTGKSDAYVRTLFAFEAGSVSYEKWDAIINTNINAKTPTENGHYLWTWKGIVEINGNNYVIAEALYIGYEGRHANGVLPAGEFTYNSLAQVYMESSATNEDVEAIDGNGNGRYDILVLSQAVQTKGFADAQTALDTAFGKTADKAAEWFEAIPRGIKVSNNAELAEAIAAGETEIYLNKGTYNMPAAAKGKTLTINGTKDSIIEVKPAGQGEAGGQLDYSLDGSTVTFNGVTIKTNSKTYAGFARLSATYNDCVIQNTYNLGVGTSVFNNCVFNITNEYLRVGGAYKAEFNNCVFNTDGRAILVFQDGTTNNQTVTVKDCTFNATAAAHTWNGIHVAAVSFDGAQGGTYTINFEGTNTVDSDFNGLYQDKTNAGNVTVNGLN